MPRTQARWRAPQLTHLMMPEAQTPVPGIPSRTESSRPIRICICLSLFHPCVGGAELQLLQLAQRWIAAGHRVQVVTRALPGQPKTETVGGVVINRVLRPWPWGPLFGFTLLVGMVWSLFRRRKEFDVVLAGQAIWEAVAAGWMARWIGKPTIARVASVGPRGDVSQVRDARGAFIWLRLWRRNSCFLAPSPKAVEELLSAGIPREKIERTTNGVDLARFAPSLSVDAERDRTVCYVGRLSPAKDPLTILRAWQLANRQGRFRLLIAGDGPLRASAEQLTEELQLQNVELLGNVEQPETVYPQATVFVLASPDEGCSNALLEAAGCGLCLIVSRTAGNLEFVAEGQTGLTFDPGQPNDLAQALSKVLEQPELRRALATAAARQVREGHDLKRIADEHVARFCRLIAESTARNG